MRDMAEILKEHSSKAKYGMLNNVSKELLSIKTDEGKKALFMMFDDAVGKNMKRKRKALFLLYAATSIIDNISFSKALELYEWVETTDEPKVEYKEYGDIIGIKDIDFGSTTIRLHKRKNPLECKMPYRDAALNSLNIIQELLEELNK